MILFSYIYGKISHLSIIMKPVNFYLSDPWLKSFTGIIDKRIGKCLSKEKHLTGNGSLSDFAMGHYYYGLHRKKIAGFSGNGRRTLKSIFLTGNIYRLEREAGIYDDEDQS